MKMIVTFMLCSLCLGAFPRFLAEAGDIGLTIEDQVLSARLRGIPLKSVLERLESEKEIWFRGDPSLLEEEVTVHFSELPFEDGLKRNLASVNYSLIYDRNERLVGVIVIGKGTADHAVSQGRAGGTRRTIPGPGRDERTDVNRPLTVMRNNLHHGGNVEVTTEERENFGVIKNSPSPGGPIEITEKERENFMVIRNSPPPGGPVEYTEQEPENFRVIRNTPPPGGSVEVTAEELQNFKVIRNSPPPGS